MSKSYDFYCVDCKTDSRFWDGNHEDRNLNKLLKLRPALELLGVGLADLDLDSCSKFIDCHLPHFAYFCAAHIGHTMRVRSEYGEFEGDCNEHRKDDWFVCRLPEKHEGEHQWEKE